jgi:RING-box protein 1
MNQINQSNPMNSTIDTVDSSLECKPVLKYWTPISEYTLDIREHECNICKFHVSDPCPQCIGTHNLKCHVSEGKCGHCFHYHCIVKWLTKEDVFCPVDRAPFEYLKYKVDDNENWLDFVRKMTKQNQSNK